MSLVASTDIKIPRSKRRKGPCQCAFHKASQSRETRATMRA